jgi:hypothetical protein
MEYKKLPELENKYPNIQSYKLEEPRIVLNGLYPETNKILFGKPNLDFITAISGSSFRFLLKVLKTESDTNPKFFTSEKYFDDLKASLKENNPYFPLESIKSEFVVTIILSEIEERFSKLKPKEENWGVNVTKNIFISDAGVDYNDLIKYIDWVIQPPNRLDIDSGGVIPTEKIGMWSSSSLDTKTLKYPNIQSMQNFNSSGTVVQTTPPLNSGGAGNSPTTGEVSRRFIPNR